MTNEKWIAPFLNYIHTFCSQMKGIIKATDEELYIEVFTCFYGLFLMEQKKRFESYQDYASYQIKTWDFVWQILEKDGYDKQDCAAKIEYFYGYFCMFPQIDFDHFCDYFMNMTGFTYDPLKKNIVIDAFIDLYDKSIDLV